MREVGAYFKKRKSQKKKKHFTKKLGINRYARKSFTVSPHCGSFIVALLTMST